MKIKFLNRNAITKVVIEPIKKKDNYKYYKRSDFGFFKPFWFTIDGFYFETSYTSTEEILEKYIICNNGVFEKACVEISISDGTKNHHYFDTTEEAINWWDKFSKMYKIEFININQ